MNAVRPARHILAWTSLHSLCMHLAPAVITSQLDPDIGAVVVAWDPTFSYSKLVYASACLRELHIPDALFVATNLDHADNIGNERRMPGTGGIVAAVETASGRRAVNVGKGGEWLFPFLLSAFADLQPGACCVVGDRLDTDIALGRQGGMLTVLPYATGGCEVLMAAHCGGCTAGSLYVWWTDAACRVAAAMA